FVHVLWQNMEADFERCRQFIFDLAGDDADEEILESFHGQFDPLYEHLETIKEGTSRIKTIVKDLKTSSHMNEEDQSEVCITDILVSTVNLVSTQYKGAVEIVTEFDATPFITCYPAKLNQVFMNLLVNACDALEDSPSGKVIVGCRLCGEAVEITVKDNGCGMNEDTRSHLFEPFFTTKGIDKGTGLGLSISYDIVHKHGGELNVESELGKGTVFRLFLPV
ncbi:MAG: HAMP domain-containing histidine kinase, partial [Psychrosphaera sp.]|nr:HAMP domain-containing histidine kinase [Psychrosphaera sp.]